MHPILFTVFGWPVPAFGVMLALAFALGCFWISKRSHQTESATLTADAGIEATAWMMLGALLGARIFYVFFFPQRFWADPLGTLLNPGGLVWYGGMLGGILAVWGFTRLRNIPFLQLADVMTPPAALGLAIGRVGCLLSGCCFGATCTLPWAITYPAGHLTHPLGGLAQHVHPSPLYESLAALAIMASLLWFEKTGARSGKNAAHGRLLAIFAILYGLARFGLEGLRGDRLVWWSMQTVAGTLSLSASQVISLAGAALGLLLLLGLNRKKPVNTIPI